MRFGDEILDAGFTVVPNLILRHYATLGITPAEMMFTIHVWEFWWSEKQPYPALLTIAKRMQMSRRNVRKYVQSLREKGFLIVTERFDEHGQTSSEYDFSPLIQAVLDRSATVGTDDPSTLGTNRPRGTEQLDRAAGNARSVEEESPTQTIEEDPERPRIERFIADFRKEMRDRAPLSSSVTRALNLYRQSGVSFEEFVGQMYVARDKTRKATNVRNRFAYFMEVLENELADGSDSGSI